MPFKPTLIIHGGAGNITRARLPPKQYERYHRHLLAHLRSARALLEGWATPEELESEDEEAQEEEASPGTKENEKKEAKVKAPARKNKNKNEDATKVAASGPRTPATALDGAVHAVSRLEDDELFNCGRGSVFTRAGTIEMEASVMVASVASPSRDNKNGISNSSSSSSGNSHSFHSGEDDRWHIKRGAGAILLRNVRNPIRLARELLLHNGLDGDGGNMHSQLAGAEAEALARAWGLQFEPDEYFWTPARWAEHRRGLGLAPGMDGSVGSRTEPSTGTASSGSGTDATAAAVPQRSGPSSSAPGPEDPGDSLPLHLPQGTVGAVCLDRWGRVAVATSTGGLTNKLPGRIGDTPTFGAGFWAEDWHAHTEVFEGLAQRLRAVNAVYDVPRPLRVVSIGRRQPSALSPLERGVRALGACLGGPGDGDNEDEGNDADKSYAPAAVPATTTPTLIDEKPKPTPPPSTIRPKTITTHRAIALSGTGNGDSFLRVAATRTAAAIARFSPGTTGSATAASPTATGTTGSTGTTSLAAAVTAVAGPGGELQQSAGPRWGITGEGEGGMIGIEIETRDGLGEGEGESGSGSYCCVDGLVRGKVVADFNSGGMWRAWVEEVEGNGDGGGEEGGRKGTREVERVMVFREEYV